MKLYDSGMKIYMAHYKGETKAQPVVAVSLSEARQVAMQLREGPSEIDRIIEWRNGL